MLKNTIKKIMNLPFINGILSWLWKVLGKAINYWLKQINGQVIFFNEKEKKEIFSLIQKIKSENKLLLDDSEAFQLYKNVESTNKLLGEIAEVGAYYGGSAKLICEAKGNRKLHLFDTFDGLPELTEFDNSPHFHKSLFVSSLDFVKHYLVQYDDVFFYKGLFPETSKPIENSMFSFVHIDVDLYEATAKSLDFFYLRMQKGGVFMIHDYDESGVKKAVDDFFASKHEIVLSIAGCYCLIVKI